MEAPLDLIPTITRKEIRDAQKAENQEDEKKVMVDQVSECLCVSMKRPDFIDIFIHRCY